MEGFGVEDGGGFWVCWLAWLAPGPPFYGYVWVVAGEADPGGEVGFVVEAGEDDFAIGGEGGENLGEVGEELGCAWADYWRDWLASTLRLRG